MGSDEVFKAGSALAGGVARRGETCGALVGVLLAVCSVVGRERLEDREQYQKAMDVAGRLYDRFGEEVGHTICAEIHRKRFGRVYHLNIPEERTAFIAEGGHSRTGCPEVCGIAARIAAEFLLDS